MIPDLSFWARTLSVLGVEIAFLTLLAAGICSKVVVARHRRAIWIGTVGAALLIVVGEACGVRDALPRRTPADIPATRAPAIVSVATSFLPAIEEETIPMAIRADFEEPPRPVWWPGYLWLAGSLMFFGYRATGHLRLARWWHQGTAKAPNRIHAELERLAHPLCLSGVEVRICPQLQSPVAFGLFRGCIVIPAEFESRFSAAERDAILLHELAHLAARDPLTLVLADALCMLAWWHPAIWWARQRLVAEVEGAADEASALMPDGRVALAESLVRLGRELATSTPSRGFGVADARGKSQLACRVRSLLTSTAAWRRPSPGERATTAAAATLAAIALLVPSWPGTAGPSLAAHLRLAALSDEATDKTPSVTSTAPSAPAPAPATSSATTNAEVSSVETKPLSSRSPEPTPAPQPSEPGTSTTRIDAEPFPLESEGILVRQKLDRITLPSVHFPDNALPDVIRQLRSLSAEHDPEKAGIWFHEVAIDMNPSQPGQDVRTPEKARIRMKVPLTGETLSEVLEAIVGASDVPIVYQVHPRGYGVSFMLRRPAMERLITRIYRINTPAWLASLGPDLESPASQEDAIDPSAAGFERPRTFVGPVSPTSLEPTPESPRSGLATRLLRQWLDRVGVATAPPNAVYFKPHMGLLLLRATAAEQAKVESALAPFLAPQDPWREDLFAAATPTSAPRPPGATHSPSEQGSPAVKEPTVTLEVKFIEIIENPKEGPADIDIDWLFGHSATRTEPVELGRPTDGEPGARSDYAESVRVEKTLVEGQSAVLNENQLRALLARLEGRGGVQLTAAPKVTTLNGQQAEIRIQDERNIVTGVQTNTPGSTPPNVTYVTEKFGLGPSVSILPRQEPGAWRLIVWSAVSEFLGYDDPGKPIEIKSASTNASKGPLYAQIPLPRLRVRKVVGEGLVTSNQSLLLRGPVTETVTQTKGSWFRASRSQVERRKLYLVVSQVP